LSHFCPRTFHWQLWILDALHREPRSAFFPTLGPPATQAYSIHTVYFWASTAKDIDGDSPGIEERGNAVDV
jgi:hypothetical protein